MGDVAGLQRTQGAQGGAAHLHAPAVKPPMAPKRPAPGCEPATVVTVICTDGSFHHHAPGLTSTVSPGASIFSKTLPYPFTTKMPSPPRHVNWSMKRPVRLNRMLAAPCTKVKS